MRAASITAAAFAVLGLLSACATTGGGPAPSRPGDRPRLEVRLLGVALEDGAPAIAARVVAIDEPAPPVTALAALAHEWRGTIGPLPWGYFLDLDPSGFAPIELRVPDHDAFVRLETGAGGQPDSWRIRCAMGGASVEVQVAAGETRGVLLPLGRDGIVAVLTVLPPGSVRKDVIDAETCASCEAPKLLEQVTPDFPEQARGRRLSGRVVVQAVIDEEGHVLDPLVAGPPQAPYDLVVPAVRAISRWRYAPATLDGKPVKVVFTVVTSYHL